MLPYQDLKEAFQLMPAQENRIIFKMAVILTKHMQEPRFCAYSYILAYEQERSIGIYLYCLNYP